MLDTVKQKIQQLIAAYEKEMQAAVKEITPDVATVESLLRVEEG